MPQGDKYIDFTNYLILQHTRGNDRLAMAFLEIEAVLGFTLPSSCSKYYWANDKTQSYALGWLHANFVVDGCDLQDRRVIFLYNPEKAQGLLSGVAAGVASAQTRQGKRRCVLRVDIPQPCAAEVDFYLESWDSLENYRMQEAALNKLFMRTYSQNEQIEDVLIKAAALNDFYSTNIYSIFPVAKHIVSLNIDKRLADRDSSLVNELASITYDSGKTRNEYSFATKYCSHHFPLDYPIYDDYIKKVLEYFRDTDAFAGFHAQQLLQYPEFKNILYQFRRFYGLEKYSLKQLDQYLWQLGKLKFPKKY